MPTPINHPAKPGFREIAWAAASVVGRVESPFTLKAQIYKWPGQKRLATVRLPPMLPENAQAWRAFFLTLNGREGTFYLADKIRTKDATTGKGAGMMDGAAQKGATINTRGWKPNKGNLFKAGEVISIADRLHDVLQDVSSDSAGDATLKLWPHVTASHADGQEIEWTAPRGVFRLMEIPEFVYNVARVVDGLTFSMEEAI